ncbi:hypothetical protein CSE16_03715 [Solibacillus sp. R5-41]|uniref:DUF5325 family protein n=1 Tax=Solibacillus sp. R5-41 TaxID=2048654 RepID=UPI000C125672|nr:DUF5325 family protein [Solibacillus sp. R5-41]ATP39210.1 hypothetical protein CSE16_03715 [Solibacillus sp. R5-41]
MNKAKAVMFIYALSAILSMVGIGFSVALVFMTGTNFETTGIIGIIVGLIAMCAIFGLGFVTKRKFREQGLL